MYEIYKGYNKKQKTYIVAKNPKEPYDKIMPFAKKYFRCSEAHVEVVIGWLLNDELYLSDPYKKGSKRCTVAYYV